MTPESTEQEIQRLIEILPQEIAAEIAKYSETEALSEVILDLGRSAEIRFEKSTYRLDHLPQVSEVVIAHVIENLGKFNSDNRAGLTRTLHRISAIRNRHGDIVGLTCRVGRAVQGVLDMIEDQIESGKNVLLLGPPGIGKTTILREAARVVSSKFQKRVIVVDTSNEIAGEGDIPHPAIGWARRMQVSSPDLQHHVMIEAVENHTPEVIIVDEIGTEEEAKAARTIAERGIQLIATAHGKTLQNLIKNPTLSDLVGGVQAVVLGDDEAKLRGTQKTVLERKSMPTFDILVELHQRDSYALFSNVAQSVDSLLRGEDTQPQLRRRNLDRSIEIHDPPPPKKSEPKKGEEPHAQNEASDTVHIFPFGVNAAFIQSAIHFLNLPAKIVRHPGEADIVVTVKAQLKSRSKLHQVLGGKEIPIHVVKSSTETHVEKFLRQFFQVASGPDDIVSEAIMEIEALCQKVTQDGVVGDASPREKYIRRLQHQAVEALGLKSHSVGTDAGRRVRVYPAQGDLS